MEGVFREETAWRLLRAMNERQATGRTDVDVFPAAVAQEVEIDPDTNTFFAVVPEPQRHPCGGNRLQDNGEGPGLA